MGTGTGSLSEIVVAGLDEVVTCVDRFAVVPSALMLVMTAPGGIPGPVTTLPISFRPWSFGDGAISGGLIPDSALGGGPGGAPGLGGVGATMVALVVPMPRAMPVTVAEPTCVVESIAGWPLAATLAIVVPGAMPVPEIRSPTSLGESAGVMPVNDLSPWVSALKVLVGSALCPDSARLACRYIQQTSSVSLTIITLPHSSSSPFFLAPPSTAGSYWPLTR